MLKLVDDLTLQRIQNNLLQSREVENLRGSWWFNVCMLLFIFGIMVSFLYFQYKSTTYILKAEETRKDIPRQGFAWNNPGIRNAIEL
jgi:hypothetical protein